MMRLIDEILQIKINNKSSCTTSPYCTLFFFVFEMGYNFQDNNYVCNTGERAYDVIRSGFPELYDDEELLP